MKKEIIFLIFICFISSGACYAGDGDYAVSKIPEALLKNSHVVKRMEEVRFEVISLGKSKKYEKYAVTVLDEEGDRFATVNEYYNKLRSIEYIEGRLFDADGKKIKTLKKSDIKDYSAVSDISLMDDNRIKFYSFYYKVYPYTVEYEVEVSYNNTYMFPVWMPQMTEKYAVERSKISIVCPLDFTFKYKANNYSGGPVVEENKSSKIFTWEIKSLPSLLKEYACPDWNVICASVIFSPDKFQIDNYKGDLSTWESFGKFIYQLNYGRDKLPENIRQKVHIIADPITDPKQKIKALYEYMQKNTRYISVQLGIGGMQPYEAEYVASKSYGDCKALSNYMYSLLKEVGIKSCYTLIKSGENEKYFNPDFPNDQFDHIVLCVPLKVDTLWLECTSQIKSAGYMGDFTDDRYALAIDENGGKLVRTPKYGLKENLQVRHIKAKLDEEGTLQISANSRYEAEQQDELEGVINYLSKDKVKEYLHRHFDFGTYDITAFDYNQNKGELPSVDEQLGITVSNYATITGKRLFIMPNVMTKSRVRLNENEERKYDVVLNYEFRDIDSVEMELPAGYEPEAKPQDISLSNKFGKYSCSLKLSGNKLYYYRSLEQYGGRYPAKDYTDLVKYFEAIYKADHGRVVLVKKE